MDGGLAPPLHLIYWEKTITTRNQKAADKAEFEDLFSELIATVRVPGPLKVTADIVLDCPTKKQVSELQRPGITEEEAQRVIFGDHFEEAMELFDGQPLFVWSKFMERYNEHFFGDPDTGK
jgi:hypothetical protein